jgi:hypothetical protein
LRTHRLALFLLLLACGPARAAEKPPEIAAVISSAAPYGEGTMRVLFLRIYDASLWTDDTHWPAAPPYALSLTYAMAFSGADLSDRTIAEMRRVAPALSDAMLKEYRAKLGKIFPAVTAGDRITALRASRARTEFFFDGRAIGTLADAAFTDAFFAIWLSPRSSDRTLTRALVHGHDAH